MYVKDLSELGRDMKDVIIVDNSPTAYFFQPENALPIVSWYDDKDDRLLYDYQEFLIELSKVEDVRPILSELVNLSQENEVDLHYGMELIRSIMEDDGSQGPGAYSAREEDDFGKEEIGGRNHHRFHKRGSYVSGRSTPHMTLPDLESESMINSHLPIQINVYNREKKLIRDVSDKCDRRRHNYYRALNSS
jgi:hypothetical protein